MKFFKKYIPTFVAMTFAISLTACNTLQGAGKDIGSVGDKIEETAAE